MSVGWVAASVRGRLLLRRRIGPERAAALARRGSLREAIVGLSGTAYGRYLEPGLSLEAAQRTVAATTLLHLRLLSGWLPPGRAEFMRSLAAGYELANVEDRLAYLLGAELRPPFDLGGLAAAWPSASQAISPAELRVALTSSTWGDPGGASPEDVHLGLRASWADRVAASVPEVGHLVSGAVALLLARELFVTGRPVELLLRRHVPAVGSGWERARTFAELAPRLPARAAWVLDGVEGPEQLWQAEIAWWERAEGDGQELVLRSREGRGVVTGVVLLLAVDTWRTASALAAAAAGGAGPEEILHAPA
jgi:hypothetical protein